MSEKEKEKLPRDSSAEAAEEVSIAAKRLRMQGETEGGTEEEVFISRTFGEKLANFWYHDKTKVFITAFFVIAIGVAVGQFVSQSNPDVCILYCGPEYITANDNQKFCSAVRELMNDEYYEDGEKKVRLTDIIYSTQNQMEAAKAEAEANGDEFKFDVMSNQKMSEKFTYEVFGSDAIICILSEEQYMQVMASGGFLPLTEIFGDAAVEGAVDEYGIRLSEMKFYEFYDAAKIFPGDAILAMRRISTMSALTGQKKAEKIHAYHLELYKNMVNFEFPAGYTPKSEAE